ncbi:MAG TPA: phosphate ABC transporter substrate-binding protein PstS [Thermoleophilaceae bacterium]|nr:phosphate ABC transporter substrate-binding protein PstS [Thermoleophilaceae bacterium]
MSPKWLAAATAGILAVGVSACGSSDNNSSGSSNTGTSGGSSSVNATLNGSGSTFAAPIYQQLGSELKGKGLTINYQPVGSGQGVSDLTNKSTLFAGSDPPMTDEELKAAEKNGQPVHVPTAFGAITVSYNLQGVKSGLQLDGPTIADIFLGKIKKWNDPAIAKQNSGMNLPSSNITIVHRSDESGTTKGFTTFLQDQSSEWKSKVGADKTVKWPTGTGAKGNDGVAAAIKQTPGAIGYVEQAYALQNNFTFANVKNKAGKYVKPTIEAVTAAGQGLKVPSDLRFTISNPSDPAAYPISSQTFIITYKDPCKAGASKNQAKGLVEFLDYILGPGQQTIKKLAYAPLPSSIDTKAKDAVKSMVCNGSPVS